MLELVRASRPAELRRALALATGMQLAAYQGAAVWAAEAEPSGPSQRDPNFTLGPVDAVWVPRVGALRSGPAKLPLGPLGHAQPAPPGLAASSVVCFASHSRSQKRTHPSIHSSVHSFNSSGRWMLC